ncbi:hypothetical protein BDZ91DRAFT_794795 [Kalaharituber pfeilii]|nr:hypothetical protein BDZ91DRAFT_794795 [Kalaharituber pfeilii]
MPLEFDSHLRTRKRKAAAQTPTPGPPAPPPPRDILTPSSSRKRKGKMPARNQPYEIKRQLSDEEAKKDRSNGSPTTTATATAIALAGTIDAGTTTVTKSTSTSAVATQAKRGLKDRVREELVKEERPKQLSELIEKAVRMDNRLFERNREFCTSEWASKTNRSGPKLMDLSAVSTKPAPQRTPTNRDLSPQERACWLKYKLCLLCAKPRHKASEYRSNTQTQQLTSSTKQDPKKKERVNISFTTTAEDSSGKEPAQTN